MPRSQPEQLFHEILHLKERKGDSLAPYHFGTGQGGGAVKISPCIMNRTNQNFNIVNFDSTFYTVQSTQMRIQKQMLDF